MLSDASNLTNVLLLNISEKIITFLQVAFITLNYQLTLLLLLKLKLLVSNQRYFYALKLQ